MTLWVLTPGQSIPLQLLNFSPLQLLTFRLSIFRTFTSSTGQLYTFFHLCSCTYGSTGVGVTSPLWFYAPDDLSEPCTSTLQAHPCYSQRRSVPSPPPTFRLPSPFNIKHPRKSGSLLSKKPMECWLGVCSSCPSDMTGVVGFSWGQAEDCCLNTFYSSLNHPLSIIHTLHSHATRVLFLSFENPYMR